MKTLREGAFITDINLIGEPFYLVMILDSRMRGGSNLISYFSLSPMVAFDKVNALRLDEDPNRNPDGAGGSQNGAVISPTPSTEEAPSS